MNHFDFINKRKGDRDDAYRLVRLSHFYSYINLIKSIPFRAPFINTKLIIPKKKAGVNLG